MKIDIVFLYFKLFFDVLKGEIDVDFMCGEKVNIQRVSFFQIIYFGCYMNFSWFYIFFNNEYIVYVSIYLISRRSCCYLFFQLILVFIR